jgi:hypothetical protein
MGLKAIVTFANFATLHPCQGNGIRLSRFNWLTSNDLGKLKAIYR